MNVPNIAGNALENSTAVATVTIDDAGQIIYVSATPGPWELERTGDKETAPAEERKHDPISNRRQEITESVPLLQNSREQTARLSWQCFHCQRRA